MSYLKELKELLEQYSQIHQIATNQSIKAFETAQKKLQPLTPILKQHFSGKKVNFSKEEKNILQDSLIFINNFLWIRPLLSEKATTTLQSKLKTAEGLQKLITDLQSKENSLDIIDTIELDFTEAQLVQFNETLDKLKDSEAFTYYYEQLQLSNETYTITKNDLTSGSGAYNRDTKTIHLDGLDVYTVSQEIFHAYQDDLNIYTSLDNSVREAEADLIACALANSMGTGGICYEWTQNIPFEYTDSNFNFDERVFTKEFDEIFNIAVEARIKMYKERENSPESYIKDNSGVGALAIKQLVRNLKSKE